MSTLHLCNTFFEWELSGEIPNHLEGAFEKSPIFLQLQFLPILYAHEGEGILATFKPDQEMEFSLYLLSENPPFSRLETWGYSKLAQNWALSRGIVYEMPDWEIVKKVNSKEYSFSKSPLPQARLLYNGDPIPTQMVLKSCFGTAGRGHMFSDNPKAKEFCIKEWLSNRPVIAEPWVDRKLDFSTQWKIHTNREIEFLGTTICKTTKRGGHISNIVGMKDPSFLGEHKAFAFPVLQEMSAMGYFGEVGFDAMVYGNNQLQPIVEINARKTMGWLTLRVQKNKFPGKEVELSFIKTDRNGPLPTHFQDQKFHPQIIISTK